MHLGVMSADVAAGMRRAPRARLAYVTAGRQSPLGVPLLLERRLTLLRWAEQAGTCVIEDDHDSEYRYSGSPLACEIDHRSISSPCLGDLLVLGIREPVRGSKESLELRKGRSRETSPATLEIRAQALGKLEELSQVG